MATRVIGVASDMDDIGKQGESDILIREIGKSHATHEYLNFTQFVHPNTKVGHVLPNQTNAKDDGKASSFWWIIAQMNNKM